MFCASGEIGLLSRPPGKLGWQRDRNQRSHRLTTAEWRRRNDLKGTLIRHVTSPVHTLAVAMIEPALQTPLVSLR